MELLDRYLKAIRSQLPETQRDDIIQELSEDIHSKIEEKEAELGRSLYEAEVEATLKGYGHPLVVAGRYRQDDRRLVLGKQLIGPALFPFYVKVLSFNLGITSVVLLVIFTVLIASGQPLSLLWGLPSVFLYQLLIQFGIVTLIFSLIDRHLAKHPDRWDSREPLRPYYPNLMDTKGARRVPRIESVSKLIGLSVLIVWLRVIQQSPFLVLGPVAGFLKFAAVWHQLYLPVVLVAFVAMAQAGINLIRPDWIRLRSVAKVGIGVAVLAIWCFLLKAGPWIVAGDTAGDLAGSHSHTLEAINECFFYALLAVVVLSAVQLLRDVYRLGRESHNHVPSRA